MLTVAAEAAEDIGNNPIRSWGDFSSVYRLFETDDGANRSTNWLNTLTLNASSYVWRPWFAVVDGSLSLSVEEMNSKGEPESKDNFTTGKLRFNLFPPSRFPFMMYVNRSRSEFDNFDFTRDQTTQEYGFLQTYRTLDGRHNYRLSYRDNERDSSEEPATVNSRNAIFSTSSNIGNQSLQFDVQADDVSNQVQQSVNYSVTGRHSYSRQSDFTADNLLSTSRTENDFGQSFSNVTTSQYSGLVRWRPRDRSKLSMTGSLRLAELEIDQFLTDSVEPLSGVENASANINQGLVYQYSEALTLSESINLSETRSGDNASRFFGNETLSATYSPMRRQLVIGDYGWNAGTSFSNQHGDEADLQRLAVDLSHSLANDIESLSTADSSVRTNINQGISRSYATDDTEQTNLDHTFTVSWNSAQLDRQTQLRFQASDSRALEGDEGKIQLLNLQYSGQFRIDRYSRLTGNLTLQRSRQSDIESSSENTVTNGQIEYNRDRAFNIPRMNFKSQLKLNKQLSVTEQLQEQIRRDRPTDLEWKNALLYRVGRLNVELHLDTLKQGGRYDYLFRFEIKRSFGDL